MLDGRNMSSVSIESILSRRNYNGIKINSLSESLHVSKPYGAV